MKSSTFLTTTAGVLAVTGLALLFAPSEVASAIERESSPLMAQLLGACLIGIGAANWLARRSPIGGIYGRSIVVGNMVLFGISALVSARAYVSHRATQLLALAVIAGALSTGFFGLLRSRGISSS
jgi:hypothetical protein